MMVTETSIVNVHLITPVVHDDARGWFARTFDEATCAGAGIETRYVQQNQSRSTRGVLRGMHVRGGAGEWKIVRCASGRIVDQVVDLRPDSPTFMRSLRVDLDDRAQQQLVLPPHVAHGFQVVSDTADIAYLHSRAYVPGDDLAFAWNDPDLDLDWPLADPVVSERDAAAPRISEVDLATAFER
ncbi:dTDP-4-dehydrorhamnose 3,5-epimerase [Ilumatobacter nonamiensis]|uniref:dTDP-4-dehydrorhamnose 3,5-epimerase n=1 Tax=Ilumatobacter nonamiensis TaxID=467093 RepID=UPI0003472266|nr:dTDP-4-dehydrorhamnose 3,5-epimerase [Ilumatobacter nonamiensis]